MAAKRTDVRPKITLACTECKERNYITREEPAQRPRPARAEEVLPRSGAHTAHRETR